MVAQLLQDLGDGDTVLEVGSSLKPAAEANGETQLASQPGLR